MPRLERTGRLVQPLCSEPQSLHDATQEMEALGRMGSLGLR